MRGLSLKSRSSNHLAGSALVAFSLNERLLSGGLAFLKDAEIELTHAMEDAKKSKVAQKWICRLNEYQYRLSITNAALVVAEPASSHEDLIQALRVGGQPHLPLDWVRGNFLSLYSGYVWSRRQSCILRTRYALEDVAKSLLQCGAEADRLALMNEFKNVFGEYVLAIWTYAGSPTLRSLADATTAFLSDPSRPTWTRLEQVIGSLVAKTQLWQPMRPFAVMTAFAIDFEDVMIDGLEGSGFYIDPSEWDIVYSSMMQMKKSCVVSRLIPLIVDTITARPAPPEVCRRILSEVLSLKTEWEFMAKPVGFKLPSLSPVFADLVRQLDDSISRLNSLIEPKSAKRKHADSNSSAQDDGPSSSKHARAQ